MKNRAQNFNPIFCLFLVLCIECAELGHSASASESSDASYLRQTWVSGLLRSLAENEVGIYYPDELRRILKRLRCEKGQRLSDCLVENTTREYIPEQSVKSDLHGAFLVGACYRIITFLNLLYMHGPIGIRENQSVIGIGTIKFSALAFIIMRVSRINPWNELIRFAFGLDRKLMAEYRRQFHWLLLGGMALEIDGAFEYKDAEINWRWFSIQNQDRELVSGKSSWMPIGKGYDLNLLDYQWIDIETLFPGNESFTIRICRQKGGSGMIFLPYAQNISEGIQVLTFGHAPVLRFLERQGIRSIKIAGG